MESRWEDKGEGDIEGTRQTEMKTQEEKSAGLKWALNNDEAPWQPAEPGILIWGWKQSDKQTRVKAAASPKLISRPLGGFMNKREHFWQYFLNKLCARFVTQTDTVHSLHSGKSHKKKDCLLDGRGRAQHGQAQWADLKTVTGFMAQHHSRVKKNMKGSDVFDWVAVFNREDNPCEHRCETFLICATLKLCHSYWRVFRFK